MFQVPNNKADYQAAVARVLAWAAANPAPERVEFKPATVRVEWPALVMTPAQQAIAAEHCRKWGCE